MSDKVTVVVRIKAQAGKEDEVRQELLDLLPPTREEAGCINFDMHQALDDDGLFLVHENWVSADDLERHFEMPHIRRWLTRSEALLAEPMELTRWRQIG